MTPGLAGTIYRLAFPGQCARNQGVDVKVLPIDIPITAWGPERDNGLGRSIGDIAVPDCDVLVCQRPLFLDFVECIEILRNRYGVRIVIDVDDDFHSLSPANSAYREVHPLSNPLANWNHLRRAMLSADVVTSTTPALARRYGGGKAVVIPNYVPAAMFDLDRPKRDESLVGWTGRIAQHPGDLEVTRGGVAKAVPFSRFAMVGDSKGVGAALGYDADPCATGMVSFADYFPALARTYDIGIVPLAPTRFNSAKSALKALEHAAVGIPVVMSPTDDNRRIHRDGIGQLAMRPRDWTRRLSKLLANNDYRIEQGERAREAARAHSIEANIDRWVQAWTKAALS